MRVRSGGAHVFGEKHGDYWNTTALRVEIPHTLDVHGTNSFIFNMLSFLLYLDTAYLHLYFNAFGIPYLCSFLRKWLYIERHSIVCVNQF